MSYTYSAAALVAAQTSLLNLLDADASPAKIVIKSAGSTVLATITLTDPAGTVNGTTGQLTLGVATQETDAPASGEAATAEIQDGAGLTHLTLPCAQGSSAVSGQCVLSSLDITACDAIEVISAVIG